MANQNLNLYKYNGFGCLLTTVGTMVTAGVGIMNDGAAFTALPVYATGEALRVVSSDTNDDGSPAGTGARTVQVIYIDTDGSIDSEIVTMDGMTVVALTDTTVARVLDIHVLTAGAAGTNIGTITIQTTGGVNRMSIPPAQSRAAPGRFTVPTGYSGLYRGFNISNATNTNLTTVMYLIEADVNPLTGALNENVFQPIDWAVSGPASGELGAKAPFPQGGRRVYLPEKCTVRARAIATGAFVSAAGFVMLELHPKPTT